MADRVAETHEFLNVFRDASSRLVELKALVVEEEAPWKRQIDLGIASHWGGFGEGDGAWVSLLLWATKPDTSSVIWGFTLTSTSTFLKVEAGVHFERDDRDGEVELWSKVTTHDQVEDACSAIKEGVEQLLSRSSLISEIDRDPDVPFHG